MTDQRRVVERYIQALQDRDMSAATWDLIHPDVTMKYPQSGEVFNGRDTCRAMFAAFPGLPTSEFSEPIGGQQEVQVTTAMPFSMPTITVTGSGDTFFAESIHTYPDGSVYHGADIVKVRDGLIFSQVSYFAAPFEAPDWRKPFAS